ncbi:universal stress protein [Clostridium cylindrosporum]|uniref:UspA domain-containing protein n=1 Tax=Clostridium cylindrosporum DSM 605 TaxID=1121307 RepID=A0A0J8DC56_CLOCY|nr:universal stress protein [Clostridium cylindrosporum]KMT21889.1 hypothetical protein CLCY_3c01600 [Clostridium cylindrosporum DSM 605]
MKIKNILIPLDESEKTLESVNTVKSLFNHQEVVIHVVHVVNRYKIALSEPSNPHEDQLKSLNILNKAEKMLSGYKVNKITQIATELSIAMDILKVINENNIDAVFMTKTGKGFFDKYIIGSETSRLLKISPVPVIVTP